MPVQVVTSSNLLAMLHEMGHRVFGNTAMVLSRDEFTSMVEGLVDKIDQMRWLWFGAEGKILVMCLWKWCN